MSIEQSNQNVGRFTHLCRRICSVILSAPLLYWWVLAYKGDPVILLVLALLSLVAGLVLFCNSFFCLFSYRIPRQQAISSLFLLLSVAGVIAMLYVLPGWKM